MLTGLVQIIRSVLLFRNLWTNIDIFENNMGQLLLLVIFKMSEIWYLRETGKAVYGKPYSLHRIGCRLSDEDV